MFEHQMVEMKSSRVVIEDVDPEVMTEVLRFIYTDKLNGIDKNADLLLAAADKVRAKLLKIFLIQFGHVILLRNSS